MTPNCPHCEGSNTRPFGSSRGRSRTKCNDCLKTFATVPSKPGRKVKGEEKKTPAQSSKDYYQRLKPEERTALNKKKEANRKKKG